MGKGALFGAKEWLFGFLMNLNTLILCMYKAFRTNQVMEIVDIVLKRLDQMMRGREVDFDEFKDLSKACFLESLKLDRESIPGSILEDLVLKAVTMSRKFRFSSPLLHFFFPFSKAFPRPAGAPQSPRHYPFPQGIFSADYLQVL